MPTIEKLGDSQSEEFAFTKTKVRNAGIVALPVYGNPAPDNPKYPNGAIDKFHTGATATPCRIVRLHAPIEELVVAWTAIKNGEAPAVPNPYLFDTNSVFKFGSVSVAVPMDQMGYPGHMWTMSGVYNYALIAPVDLNSTIKIGITPWETDITVDQSIVPNVYFLSSLLEKLPYNYTYPEFVP